MHGRASLELTHPPKIIGLTPTPSRRTGDPVNYFARRRAHSEQESLSDGLHPALIRPGPARPYRDNGGGNFNIYGRYNGPWQMEPGQGTDIDSGTNGNTWLIATNPIAGGYPIYQLNGSTWIQVSGPNGGGAIRVAVAPDGRPWVIVDNGGGNYNIYVRNPDGGWLIAPGLGLDLDIGANGAQWLIGKDPIAGGYPIYQWNGSTWIQVSGPNGGGTIVWQSRPTVDPG